MNTKHQVLNRKMNLFLLLKPNICKCKNKKKTSHTEVHITKISPSSHDRNFPKQYANLKFWSKKILKENQKGHCVRIPYTISV